MKKIVIAIDGFSSCGKSTMAKDLARATGYAHIDSGAMYRAVTLYALQNGFFETGDRVDPVRLESALPDIQVAFAVNPATGQSETILNGANVEKEIRGMEVAGRVSGVSALPFVREALVERQRSLGGAKGVVMDGRDIGTVVFPAAELKIFVTASAEVRAGRRLQELQSKGEAASFEEILANVKSRDDADTARAVSPLRKAPDAIELDNTYMTVPEQQAWLLEQYRRAAATDVEIDADSGFCFGVVNAIDCAERELDQSGALCCLGDLVHNNLEMARLKKRGLQTVDRAAFSELRNRTVLLRAHGEPPATYETARRNGITLVDATCPVVLQLQRRIRDCHGEIRAAGGQLVIYGKQGHAEVNGLVGQTGGEAIVVETVDDLVKLDFSREIALFSQTTESLDGFSEMVEAIRQRVRAGVRFRFFDTVCRQVANRMPGLKAFVARRDLVYFVAGQKSSNGRMLFDECRKANPNVLFISGADEITDPLPAVAGGAGSIGVCGATSTPKWLMEEVAERLREINKNSQ